MKRYPVILTLLILLAFAACAPKEEAAPEFDFNNTCWFDGYEFFVGSTDTISNEQDLYIFQGGTLHEGGSTFALRRIAVDTFIIQPMPGQDWVAVGVEGDTATREVIGDQVVIICHSPEDPECDTLWMFDPGDKTPYEAYGDLLLQKRLDDIAGTYYDAKKKMTYQFIDTTLIRTPDNGKADTQHFHIFYSFDMPSHILVLSEKEQLWYEKTPTGMKLFKPKYWVREEDYSREACIATLERIDPQGN